MTNGEKYRSKELPVVEKRDKRRAEKRLGEGEGSRKGEKQKKEERRERKREKRVRAEARIEMVHSTLMDLFDDETSLSHPSAMTVQTSWRDKLRKEKMELWNGGSVPLPDAAPPVPPMDSPRSDRATTKGLRCRERRDREVGAADAVGSSSDDLGAFRSQTPSLPPCAIK